MKSDIDKKIDLISAFIQFEGDISISSICINYDLKGGVEFTGYRSKDDKQIKITMDKSQVEAIEQCNTIKEIYDSYKEMEYF